jgi:hypothetical protein
VLPKECPNHIESYRQTVCNLLKPAMLPAAYRYWPGFTFVKVVAVEETMTKTLDQAQRHVVASSSQCLIQQFALAPSFTNFLIAIAITGIGQGVYLAIDLALATAVLPEGGREAGKDLGVFNIASALPGTAAPAIAPIFLAIGGGSNYTALFIAAAVLAFLGALSIQPMKGVR